MTRGGWRIVRTAVWIACGVVGAVVLFRFPWRATFKALAGAAPELLLAAALVNLVSIVAKGWAWHLLLRRIAPNRWVVAQEATLIGSAANSLSIAVIGEVARANHVGARDRVPLESAMASIAWTRAAEALGLAVFMLSVPTILHLPPILKDVQVLAGVLLCVLLAVAWTGRWWSVSRWIPTYARSALAKIATIGSPVGLVLPVLLTVVSWGAQWMTYHLTLVALHIPATLASSFTALVVCNVGGLARATPGNVGITQGAMALALLPFGIKPHASVAAGLALQGIQIIPVLLLTGVTVGWKALPMPAWLRRGPNDRKERHEAAVEPSEDPGSVVATAAERRGRAPR